MSYTLVPTRLFQQIAESLGEPYCSMVRRQSRTLQEVLEEAQHPTGDFILPELFTQYPSLMLELGVEEFSPRHQIIPEDGIADGGEEYDEDELLPDEEHYDEDEIDPDFELPSIGSDHHDYEDKEGWDADTDQY